MGFQIWKEGSDSVNELVHVGNVDISVKEYRGQRVATFYDIDGRSG